MLNHLCHAMHTSHIHDCHYIQVLGITFGVCLMTWVFSYAAFDLMSLTFPLMPQMDTRHLMAMASLGATLMMTRSPASAVSYACLFSG